MTNVNVVIGAGLIGQAIARRVGVGKHVLLADVRLSAFRCLSGRC
jgi:3-hydroxyacyl-CoA dehydrogenase